MPSLRMANGLRANSTSDSPGPGGPQNGYFSYFRGNTRRGRTRNANRNGAFSRGGRGGFRGSHDGEGRRGTTTRATQADGHLAKDEPAPPEAVEAPESEAVELMARMFLAGADVDVDGVNGSAEGRAHEAMPYIGDDQEHDRTKPGEGTGKMTAIHKDEPETEDLDIDPSEVAHLLPSDLFDGEDEYRVPTTTSCGEVVSGVPLILFAADQLMGARADFVGDWPLDGIAEAWCEPHEAYPVKGEVLEAGRDRRPVVSDAADDVGDWTDDDVYLDRVT